MQELDSEELMIDGRAIKVNLWSVGKTRIVILDGLIRTARIEEEEYEDVEDPESIIKALRKANPKPDIFTFVQRLPETEPKYSYYREWESIAAIPIKTYDHWWKQRRHISQVVLRLFNSNQH